MSDPRSYRIHTKSRLRQEEQRACVTLPPYQVLPPSAPPPLRPFPARLQATWPIYTPALAAALRLPRQRVCGRGEAHSLP